jgi:hypothetical protein
MSYKTFVQGTVLNASDVNTYLMKQAVISFASDTARTSALATPTYGMVTFLENTGKLDIYDGSAWQPIMKVGAWDTWLAAFTNLTLGNGTQAITYARTGKVVHMRGRITFGSTTSVSGAISISLPVTATGVFTGQVTMRAGGTDFTGYIASTSTTLAISAINSAGTYASRATTSATVPGTWANGDNITFSITYEAA